MKLLPAARLLARARIHRVACEFVATWFVGVGADLGLQFAHTVSPIYDCFAASDRLDALIRHDPATPPTHSVTTLGGL